jgi:hypothetical protein
MKAFVALFLAMTLVGGAAAAEEKPVADITVQTGSVVIHRGAAVIPVDVRLPLNNGDKVYAGDQTLAKIKYRGDCRRTETVKDGEIRTVRRRTDCALLLFGGASLAAEVALALYDPKPVSP